MCRSLIDIGGYQRKQQDTRKHTEITDFYRGFLAKPVELIAMADRVAAIVPGV
jgi:hypothetical protein